MRSRKSHASSTNISGSSAALSALSGVIAGLTCLGWRCRRLNAEPHRWLHTARGHAGQGRPKQKPRRGARLSFLSEGACRVATPGKPTDTIAQSVAQRRGDSAAVDKITPHVAARQRSSPSQTAPILSSSPRPTLCLPWAENGVPAVPSTPPIRYLHPMIRSFCAARLSSLLCTRTSRTSPSASTARHR